MSGKNGKWLKRMNKDGDWTGYVCRSVPQLANNRWFVPATKAEVASFFARNGVSNEHTKGFKREALPMPPQKKGRRGSTLKGGFGGIVTSDEALDPEAVEETFDGAGADSS